MKISIIGGAGVRTVIFINGLLHRCEKLNINEVVLYDIDTDKLEVIEKLCKHVIHRKQGNLQLTAAKTAKEAIIGADYIVTTIRAGGDHSRVVDESEALETGIIGQETTGAGGFSMAVRTIPVLMDYCELIKKYAKDAWIFNFTNPSGIVTQALRSAGYHRVIGICDAPSSTKYRMAKALQVKEEELYVEFFGLNHLSWIQSVKLKGKEILDDLLEDDNFLTSVQEFSMFDKRLLKMIGRLPNEYLYYYYHKDKALHNMQGSDMLRGKTIEAVNNKMMDELKKIDIDKDPKAALQTFLYYMQVRENSYMSIETGEGSRPIIEKGNLPVPDGMGYAGVMLSCIEGLQSEEGTYLVLSVENQNCTKELNPEDVIEVTCHVSNQGIHPVPIKAVPDDCMMMIKLMKTYEKMVVKAIETRSKETAIRALMLNPLVGSFSLAQEIINRYDEVYNGLLK